MNREYTVGEFRKVVDTLCELVPRMQIAYADLLGEKNTVCSLKSTAEVMQQNRAIICGFLGTLSKFSV
jgi:hypothetical protein